MLQLLGLAVVELLDVTMLVVDHVHQALDLCFQVDHLLLTWHRGLDKERDKRLETGEPRLHRKWDAERVKNYSSKEILQG